ncbi:MAG: bifunctional homocysteine S-methyltransferase/methylenetetrahydrofolate reductase [Anaerolineae bacterium]|nr:bifunctional homocysteine S-methyltransferase/methylenetetrahydrofolate reductase [Anaerolineae bacterium]
MLADGAMGTLLHARGASIDTPFDALNIDNPALIRDVHRAYLEAGAELIETNTFGANRYKLGEYGQADQVTIINRAGVELARQTIDFLSKTCCYIAGSVGPLGVRLAPFGRVSVEQARAAFHEQIEALVAAGVDVVLLETFSDRHELAEAFRAAREVSDTIPIIAQVTFTRDDRTLLGDTPTQVAEALAELGVDVIGVNCANGPVQVTRVLDAMQTAAPQVYFSALPNAGWPEYVGGRVMYPAGPDYFADFAVSMRNRGVRLVGGCCGTTPEHIAAMRTALDNTEYVSVQPDRQVAAEAIEEVIERAAPSELAQKLAEGTFVISVEMSPPKGLATEKIIQAAHMLREAGADAINVTDSPMARMRMSPWAVCHLLQSQGRIETVLHFPTRGRNLLRVQGDLLAAHALGVRNLFVVMGDPTRVGDYPDAADNYDIVPSGLVELINHNLNEGKDWAGNSIGQPTNFLVGCALNLAAPDLDREIKTLQKKLKGGADFLITQPIFEIDLYHRFVERYEELHGPLNIPILVGVMPLASLRHATFLHNEVPGIVIPTSIISRIEAAGDDARALGVELAQELGSRLRSVAKGMYLMPQFGRYDLIAEIIEGIKEDNCRRAVVG